LESGRDVTPPVTREHEATAPPAAAPPPRAVRTQTTPRPRQPTTQPSSPSGSQAKQPQQPLDLRPPGSRGSSLLENLFGR